MITPVHDRILRSLGSLHLLTAEQLCRIHYSDRSITYVKALLKELVDAGYVVADAVPTKRYRSPYYYRLSQRGTRYLQGLGIDACPPRSDLQGLFITHTLELNDVLISAAHVQKVDPSYRLEIFRHERELKRAPIRLEGMTVIPDAFLDFRRGSLRQAVLLEHDRGTEGESYFKRKVKAYLLLLHSGAYKEHFGVKSVSVAVTTFVGQVRAQQLKQWTRDETDSNRFWFASLPQPPTPSVWLEPLWLSAEYPPLPLLAA